MRKRTVTSLVLAVLAFAVVTGCEEKKTDPPPEEPASTLSVTSPASGQTWHAGTEQTITWTDSGDIPAVTIEFSYDTWTWTALASSITNTQSHMWVVQGEADSTVYLRVSDASDGDPFSVITFQLASGTWYVDTDAQAGGNGTSWGEAFQTIQEALEKAESGDEIWVAQGTYYRFGSDANVVEAEDGLRLYGGFEGTETSKTDRNPVSFPTILDGEDVANHVIDCTSASDIVVSGFTITGGNNTAQGGGGVYAPDGASDLRIDDCTITDNHTGGPGGGVYISDAGNTTIENCTFSSNTCGTNFIGGGMCIGNSSSSVTPRIVGCVFTGNTNSALCLSGLETHIVENCVFYGNSAMYGAAVSIFCNNVDMENCLIHSNTVTNKGAVYIYSIGGTLSMRNCTLFGNTSPGTGGAVYNEGASVSLANCIVWSHAAIFFLSISGTLSCTYSCVESGSTTSGNVNTNPAFVDAGNGDFHLQSTSPCIDAGDGNSAPSLDLDGNSRADVGTVANTGTGAPTYTDMGVYEYQP